jgi:hypothetical protein
VPGGGLLGGLTSRALEAVCGGKEAAGAGTRAGRSKAEMLRQEEVCSVLVSTGGSESWVHFPAFACW